MNSRNFIPASEDLGKMSGGLMLSPQQAQGRKPGRILSGLERLGAPGGKFFADQDLKSLFCEICQGFC